VPFQTPKGSENSILKPEDTRRGEPVLRVSLPALALGSGSMALMLLQWLGKAMPLGCTGEPLETALDFKFSFSRSAVGLQCLYFRGCPQPCSESQDFKAAVLRLLGLKIPLCVL
jgi:hypothetical protein